MGLPTRLQDGPGVLNWSVKYTRQVTNPTCMFAVKIMPPLSFTYVKAGLSRSSVLPHSWRSVAKIGIDGQYPVRLTAPPPSIPLLSTHTNEAHQSCTSEIFCT